MTRIKQSFTCEIRRYSFSEYERNTKVLKNRIYLMFILAGVSLCLLPLFPICILGIVLSLASIQSCSKIKKELIINYLDHAEKEWVTVDEKNIYSWNNLMCPKKVTEKERIVDVIVGETICFWTESNGRIKFVELPKDHGNITFERLPEGAPYIEYQAEQYVEFGFFDLLETTEELTEEEKKRWPQQHRMIIHTESVRCFPFPYKKEPIVN
jgi:hypothetical protein